MTSDFLSNKAKRRSVILETRKKLNEDLNREKRLAEKIFQRMRNFLLSFGKLQHQFAELSAMLDYDFDKRDVLTEPEEARLRAELTHIQVSVEEVKTRIEGLRDEEHLLEHLLTATEEHVKFVEGFGKVVSNEIKQS